MSFCHPMSMTWRAISVGPYLLPHPHRLRGALPVLAEPRAFLPPRLSKQAEPHVVGVELGAVASFLHARSRRPRDGARVLVRPLGGAGWAGGVGSASAGAATSRAPAASS